MKELAFYQLEKQIHDTPIISCCLYNSSKLCFDKHVKPLIDFFYKKNPFPIYLFINKDFIYLDELKKHFNNIENKTQIFVIYFSNQDEDFSQHLFRYYGGFVNAPACCYLGTDDLNLGHLENAYTVAKLYNFDFICHSMECSPRFFLSGKSLSLNKFSTKIASFIQNYRIYNNPSADWNIDQECIVNMVEKLKPKLCLICPTSVYNIFTQNFITNQLNSKSIIVIRPETLFDKYINAN